MPVPQQALRPAEADLQHLQAYLKDQEFFDEIVVLKDADMNYENLRYFLEVYFPERLKNSPKSRFHRVSESGRPVGRVGSGMPGDL